MDIERFKSIEIKELVLEPPNSVIPALQQFRDAPHKFQRMALIPTLSDNFFPDLVFIGDECLVSTSQRRMVFITRTSKQIYSLDLEANDFPEELNYYVMPDKVGYKPFEKSIEDFFKPNPVEVDKLIIQGSLEIQKIASDEALKRHAETLPVQFDEEYNRLPPKIFNHQFEGEDFYLYRFPQHRGYFLLEAFKPVKITSPDHDDIELREGWYILYHPPPQVD